MNTPFSLLPRRALRLLLLGVMLAITPFAVAASSSQSDQGGHYFVAPGFKVRVYRGPWSKNLDLNAQTPISTQTVRNLDSRKREFKCKVPKKGFTVISGYLDVPNDQAAWFAPGYGASETAVMYVDGKQVCSKLPGQDKKTKHSIDLTPGMHPFRIIQFTPVDRLVCFTSLENGRLGRATVRVKLKFTPQMQTALVSALEALTRDAIKPTLSKKQLDQYNKLLDDNQYIFGKSERIMRAALDFVAAHDAHHNYLFKVHHDEWGKKTPRTGIRWAVFQTMQYLLDHAYTPENLARYPKLLGSVKFATADYFPGRCPKPSNSDADYSVRIWASYPRTPAYDIWMKTWSTVARKATGAYLSPGTIATVTVPESMVNKGYRIRVGANSCDMSHKWHINRLFRISLTYPITANKVEVANPLGGGIYIEVPIGADAGVVDLKFKNIVRAPFYANTRANKTTLAQWQNVERHYKAPWADFQSKAFMMQVPTTWIYNLKDPVTLMGDWDKAVTAVCHVMGYSIDDLGREPLYIQPDTQAKAAVFSPGYPQVNSSAANPGVDKYHGYNNKKNHYVSGPLGATSWVFHEWGHALNLANPAGEKESSNNFLYTAALNLGLGVKLDKAFSGSRGSNNPRRTLDNTAILWMTALNFNSSVMQIPQKAYQLKGHAKYVDIARLFGWKTIANFYKQVQADRTAFRRSGGKDGAPWPKNVSNDYYILHLSESSGIDMRPLFHFWGTPPWSMLTLQTNPESLKKAVTDAKAKLAKFEAQEQTLKKTGKKPNRALWHAIKNARRDVHDAVSKLENFPQKLADAKHYAQLYDDLIKSGQIRRSAKIYDELEKYKNLVPPDNAALRKFTLIWFNNWKGKPPAANQHLLWSANDHRQQWAVYNKASAAAIRAHIDQLIKMYFPDGRPSESSE